MHYCILSIFTTFICVCAHVTNHIWRSEGSLRTSVLFFNHVGLGMLTQVIQFGKLLNPLSTLSSCIYEYYVALTFGFLRQDFTRDLD